MVQKGHVAIVTGASRGLGKALARELLVRGLLVIVDGRDEVELSARAELGESGKALAIAGDVNDPNHVHALVAAARRAGRLDLVVNNASSLGEGAAAGDRDTRTRDLPRALRRQRLRAD